MKDESEYGLQPIDAGDQWGGAKKVIAEDDVTMACLEVTAMVAETVAYLSPVGPAEIPSPAEQGLVIEVAFHGHCHGQMTMALSPGLHEALARSMLGIDPAEPIAADQAEEAAKELGNILAGNVIARLWGSDVEFKLSPPRVSVPCVLSGAPCVALELAEGRLSLSVDAICSLG